MMSREIGQVQMVAWLYNSVTLEHHVNIKYKIKKSL
jgi:hypothetical protein